MGESNAQYERRTAAQDRDSSKATDAANKADAAKEYDLRLDDRKTAVVEIKGGPKMADYPGADSGNISARAKYDKAVRDYKRDHSVASKAASQLPRR